LGSCLVLSLFLLPCQLSTFFFFSLPNHALGVFNSRSLPLDHAHRCGGFTYSTRHTTVEGQPSLLGGGQHAFQRPGHQTRPLFKWCSTSTTTSISQYQGPAGSGCAIEGERADAG
jgi:hypothetical protein